MIVTTRATLELVVGKLNSVWARLGLSQFADKEDGNIVILFAFTSVVALVSVGGGIDFLTTMSTRSKAQQALDASLLYAASQASNSRLGRAQAYFRANFDTASVGGSMPNFSVDPDGSVTGLLSTKVKTNFLGLIGIKSLPVVVSGASSAIYSTTAEVAFTPTLAQGWYAKDIFAFLRDPQGNIVERVKVLSYNFDPATGIGATDPPFNNSSQTFTLTGGNTFGVMMRVWPNSVNIGSRKGSYVDYYSDDPAPRIHTSGDCSGPEGQTNNWEDGGNFDYMDFVYSMKCSQMVGAPTAVRLVK